jgi:dihydropteroate synthase
MSRYNVFRIYPRTQDEIHSMIKEIGCDPGGLKIMAPKGEMILIRVENLSLRAANILKQEMLSRGGDVVLHRDVAGLTIEKSAAIIMGTRRQLNELLIKLRVQPFGLKTLGREIEEMLKAQDQLERRGREIWLPHGAKPLRIGERTLVMGILNVTPDSFSDGGKYIDIDQAVEHAHRLIEEGADIIDVGGESTRPGAEKVPLETEANRVLPVIEALSRRISVPISIDTYKAEVARRAIQAGAHIINDVWGAKADPDMAKLVADTGAPIILMHNRENMNYSSLIPDMMRDLRESIELILSAGGMKEQIILDPGIGFAKTLEHNLEIMARLEEFTSLGYPILLGTSRKSFIGKTLDLPVDQRVEGTIATVVLGIQKGADIVRVHDVGAVSRAARMTDAMVKGGE